MRDYPILHGCKSTSETIQFYMDVNQHVRDYPIYMDVNQQWETIQFYMDVNQHERLSNFTWM